MGLSGFKFTSNNPLNFSGDFKLFIRNSKKGNPVESQLAIAYGKNGSGKSTLAKLLGNPAPQQNPPFTALYCKENGISELPVPEAIDNCYLFNEEFVNENIKIASDELGAIALVGPQVDVDQELEQLESANHSLSKTCDELTEDIRANDEKYQKTIENIKLNLKETWAKRSAKIEGRARKNVTDTILQQLASPKVFDKNDTPLDELQNNLQSEILNLESYRGLRSENWIAPTFRNPFDKEAVKRSLLATPQEDSTNPTSQLVGLFAKAYPSVSQLNHLIDFLDQDPSHCDKCLQKVSTVLKEDLRNLAKQQLQTLRMQNEAQQVTRLLAPIPDLFSLPSVAKISSELERKTKDSFDRFRKEIILLNSQIKQKEDQPHLEISVSFDSLELELKDLQNCIALIQESVTQHNSIVTDFERLSSNVKKLNLNVAIRENRSDLIQALQSELKIAALSIKLNKARNKFNSNLDRIGDLERKIKKTDIAIEEINSRLFTVFASRKLSLRAAEKGYRVLCNERMVPPEQLSTGERNILGLCYFFVHIAQDQSIEDAYRSKKILIIDDPISSFDSDNKYGALALLVKELSQYHSNKGQTRTLVLTHDLTVAYDFSKAISSSTAPATFVLEKQKLRNMTFDGVDVYRSLLGELYNTILTSNSKESDLMSLRRVYEAFVRFQFNVGIGDSITNKALQSLFQELGEEQTAFIETFLASPFMNRGAHEELSILTLDFYSTAPLSPEDKIKFIRETLVFIHLISPWHIPARLATNYNEQQRIKQRLDELTANAMNDCIQSCKNSAGA